MTGRNREAEREALRRADAAMGHLREFRRHLSVPRDETTLAVHALARAYDAVCWAQDVMIETDAAYEGEEGRWPETR